MKKLAAKPQSSRAKHADGASNALPPAIVHCSIETECICHLRSAAKDAPTGETKSQEDNDELSRAPENKQQVLLRVSFEGLPSPGPDADEAIAQLLNIKYEELTKIFAHYCKLSDCKTTWTATHLKLGARHAPLRRSAFALPTSAHLTHAVPLPLLRPPPLPSPPRLLVGMKRLVRDAGLERKVYNIDAITRLFNLTAGLKARSSPPSRTCSLSLPFTPPSILSLSCRPLSSP